MTIEFPPGSGPYGVTATVDAVWVTLVHAGAVARVPVHPDGRAGRPRVTDLDDPDCRPSVLCAAPDGAVWFSRTGDDAVGHVDRDGRPTRFPVPAGSGPYGVAPAADGVWFTDWGTAHVVDVAGGEVRRRVDLAPGREPHGLAVGPDGAVWVALESGTLAQVPG